ncbi:MAG: hypothetical protein AAFY70_16770 [Bacteroidota bacterium]
MNQWLFFLILMCSLWACDPSHQETSQTDLSTKVDASPVDTFDLAQVYRFMDSSAYEVNDWISLDVDGDGLKEHVVKVVRKIDKKRGIFMEKPSGGWQLMGAGSQAISGGDDFRWMNQWRVWVKDSVPQNTYAASGDLKDVYMIPIRGQALELVQEEGKSVFIYWESGQYKSTTIE